LGARRYGFWRGLEDRVALDLGRCVAGVAAAGGRPRHGLAPAPGRGRRADGFREPVVRAVCAAVAEAGGLPGDLDALAGEVAAAVLAADPGGRDRRTVERYAGAAHTREIALWAARQQARQASQVHQLRADIFRTRS
jgi:hypothetical protein